jgi:hypothetical protein
VEGVTAETRRVSMTGKADFTAEEWETILEGPTSAGLLVSAAQRGGTFREAYAMAKVYAEARQEHGESELLDEIVAHKPKVDRGGAPSLEHIRHAVELLAGKATPEEVDEYRRFVVSLAERVAAAKGEGDEPVSEAEQAAIAEIRTALA